MQGFLQKFFCALLQTFLLRFCLPIRPEILQEIRTNSPEVVSPGVFLEVFQKILKRSLQKILEVYLKISSIAFVCNFNRNLFRIFVPNSCRYSFRIIFSKLLGKFLPETSYDISRISWWSNLDIFSGNLFHIVLPSSSMNLQRNILEYFFRILQKFVQGFL